MATVIAPPDGQTPLSDWADANGNRIASSDLYKIYTPGSKEGNAAQWAYRAFQTNYGRNPTAQELAMVLPSYGSGNVTDVAGGDAAVAGLAAAQQNTPTAIAARQQQQALDKYNGAKDVYNKQVNDIFQGSLGRDATADEASHFGALLASGQADQYGINQLLGQTAEAQNRQTQQYQDTLSKNLQGTQADYFKNYINPTILSQTAAAGRDPNSSGVIQAQIQAGKQQNYDLQNYLAQFGAQQYGQSAQNQQAVYQQYLGNQYALNNANVNQALGQQSYLQQRNTDIQNYNMQQQAYANYLNQYGKRSNGIGGLIGGGIGAIAGGYFGGPQGAQTGFQLGSGLGNGIQGATSGRTATI